VGALNGASAAEADGSDMASIQAGGTDSSAG
jgi:hypothetical protein